MGVREKAFKLPGTPAELRRFKVAKALIGELEGILRYARGKLVDTVGRDIVGSR